MATDQAMRHPLSDILGAFAGDVKHLVKGEIALARAEVDQKLRGLVIAAVLIVGGALVAFAGLVVLLEGGAAVLAYWLPAWASLLIVGIVIVAVGGTVSWIGVSKLSLKAIKPERMIANVQRDVHMIKDRG
ncbi:MULTISPECIES: phage holin family protein [unclassified Sphingomonas]|uniref:phage holin family protein n=1 Tax=unclassified Sphingomonas TaxID=196159 RepID=UPI002269CD63|nr:MULTISPECIES: phage holin family protein [unclassified Sphingomonas]